jgi:hypothetical protein
MCSSALNFFAKYKAWSKAWSAQREKSVGHKILFSRIIDLLPSARWMEETVFLSTMPNHYKG